MVASNAVRPHLYSCFIVTYNLGNDDVHFIHPQQISSSILTQTKKFKQRYQLFDYHPPLISSGFVSTRSQEKMWNFISSWTTSFSFLSKGQQQPSATAISIKVRCLTGKEFEIAVEHNTRIHTVKEMIEEKEGIPPNQQRLIYGGKQMMDTKEIKDYELQAGATLHLVLTLRGGSF